MLTQSAVSLATPPARRGGTGARTAAPASRTGHCLRHQHPQAVSNVVRHSTEFGPAPDGATTGGGAPARARVAAGPAYLSSAPPAVWIEMRCHYGRRAGPR
jgi:hypothetical protein